ncbi:hypothetical protein [Runella salmonicolor]|uniref:Uncharacterized protein n=1 Tax=Runella salmonicolor TaxID=2950278 RepID=A0ABT1FTS7_9BACT|nr:hypothetical protein [Runella salmonicolor]MCP1384048.1 hypothetical protein [Runella salmonicolor]
MQNSTINLNIPQIKALDELYEDLRGFLPESVMEKVLDVHFEVTERFRLQLEITEFLSAKLIAVSDGL